jgi:hypothetical protein
MDTKFALAKQIKEKMFKLFSNSRKTVYEKNQKSNQNPSIKSMKKIIPMHIIIKLPKTCENAKIKINIHLKK